MSESSCCGAQIIHADLCAKCKDHCDVIEVFCIKCDWAGKESELAVDNDLESFWQNSYCPECHSKEIKDV